MNVSIIAKVVAHSTPSYEDPSLGPPVLHPSYKDPSLGTPVLVFADLRH